MSGERLDEALACVIRRMPGLAGAIEAEYGRSAGFRSLCEDYLLCVDAETRWGASEAPVASIRRQEYAQWRAELEAEIVDWLEAGAAGAQTEAEAKP